MIQAKQRQLAFKSLRRRQYSVCNTIFNFDRLNLTYVYKKRVRLIV